MNVELFRDSYRDVIFCSLISSFMGFEESASSSGLSWSSSKSTLIPVISFLSSTKSIRYSPILLVLSKLINYSCALSSSIDSERFPRIALKLRTSMNDEACWLASCVRLLSCWSVILTSSRLLISSASLRLMVSKIASNYRLWQRRLTNTRIAWLSILSLSWVLLWEVKCLTHSWIFKASTPITSTESLSSLFNVWCAK